MDKKMISRSFSGLNVKILLAFIFVLAPFGLKAFSDGSPNFEVVVTDSSGQPKTTSEIELLVELTSGKLDGKAQYAENHTLITSDAGIARFAIGFGKPTDKKFIFDNFDVSQGKNYLRVSIKEAGGHRLLLNSQLANVPIVQKWLFADGKSNTVIAIMITVWLGILVYLLLTNRKMKALEAQLENLKQQGGQEN